MRGHGPCQQNLRKSNLSSVSPLWRSELEFIAASIASQMEPPAGKAPAPEAVLHRPLRPLQSFVTLVGLGPQVHDATTGEFHVTWRNLGGVNTLLTAGYMVVLTAVTIFSLLRYFAVCVEDQDSRSIKIIGVVMVGGYQLNALVQVLNAVYSSRRLCRLLNSWNRLAKIGVNPPGGLYLRSCVQVTFMLAFMAAMLALTIMGQPRLLTHINDGLAEWMFLVPRKWLTHSTFFTKVVHGAVCLVFLHQFAMNKGSVFSFTNHCHLLQSALGTWNTQLTRAIHEVWQQERQREDRLALLQESHHLLVTLVRDTQEVYSPVLQSYFATGVVIVCTELYLLAKCAGSGVCQVEGVVILALLTLQTSGLLVHLSIAAGAVQEKADASGDVLGRGVPYEATDKEKFIVGELMRSVSISPLYITGGNFFTINRSFILTVMSVIASYFIVILQFMHSCSTPNTETLTTNLTQEAST